MLLIAFTQAIKAVRLSSLSSTWHTSLSMSRGIFTGGSEPAGAGNGGLAGTVVVGLVFMSRLRLRKVSTDGFEESFCVDCDQPWAVVAPMRYGPRFSGAVSAGLFAGRLDVQPLHPLNFPMDWQAANHIRRIRTTAELLPSAGIISFGPEHVAPLALAAVAFLFGVHSIMRL